MTKLHKPPGLGVLLLDDIPILFNHPRATAIAQHFLGKEFMCKLPSGQLYYESKLSLDDDGSVYFSQDPSGQPTTAAKMANGGDLDADIINYFVLPGGFYPAHGIRKGDISVVIYGVRQAFACFGDVGPSGSLGEGSIALHRELGNETIRGRDTATGGTLVNRGIDRGVITIVFPGSGNGHGRTNEESAAIGAPLFAALKQEASAYRQQLEQAVGRIRDLFMPRILNRL